MTHVPANIDRFSGFADTYDAYRPTPPSVIVDILTQLAKSPRPARVVDIGSGTGLSTRIWSSRAREVIGIEPNADMRRQAEMQTARFLGMENVLYREGVSNHTGLPDESADIVTCSQCFHWLEPVSTLTEVTRILRPGGVFAAYDCDWPPTIGWEIATLYKQFMARVGSMEKDQGVFDTVTKWDKSQHLARIKDSGRFRYTNEVLVHSTESGTADRLIGLVRSFGGLTTLLKRGLTEQEIGLPQFEEKTRQLLGNTPQPWYFSYRIRLGIK